ncbi:hypothetical protein ACLOJK_034762 [Asimina triloba]
MALALAVNGSWARGGSGMSSRWLADGVSLDGQRDGWKDGVVGVDSEMGFNPS